MQWHALMRENGTFCDCTVEERLGGINHELHDKYTTALIFFASVLQLVTHYSLTHSQRYNLKYLV